MCSRPRGLARLFFFFFFFSANHFSRKPPVLIFSDPSAMVHSQGHGSGASHTLCSFTEEIFSGHSLDGGGEMGRCVGGHGNARSQNAE